MGEYTPESSDPPGQRPPSVQAHGVQKHQEEEDQSLSKLHIVGTLQVESLELASKRVYDHTRDTRNDLKRLQGLFCLVKDRSMLWANHGTGMLSCHYRSRRSAQPSGAAGYDAGHVRVRQPVALA